MKHHNHHQHPYSSEFKRRIFTRRIERRIQAGADLLLALAIGIGLAVLLVAWWSS